MNTHRSHSSQLFPPLLPSLLAGLLTMLVVVLFAFVLIMLASCPADARELTEADLDAARMKIEAAQKELKALDDGQSLVPRKFNLDAIPLPAAPTGGNQNPVDIEALAKQFARKGNAGKSGSAQEQGPRLLAFVSFGMPLATLQQMAADAERTRTTFVLRGMIQRDMQETMKAVRQVIGKHKVSWFIDPEAFKRFGVTAVPSYVLLKRDAVAQDCGGSQCFADRDFAKVSGDVSIHYALDQIDAQLPLYRDVVASVRSAAVKNAP